MVVVRITTARAIHFDITFLLRKITANTAGNKLNEFGRISNISINPIKAQEIPPKGCRGVANAPQKNMNRAIDIGNSVDKTNEYQRSRGKEIKASCPHNETSRAR